MKISKLSWHDGIIKGVNFKSSSDDGNIIILNLELYKEQIYSKNRDAINVKCIGVHSFTVVCDIGQLNSNEFAGNISNGWTLKNTLRMFLTDGYVEIKACKFKVKKA